MHGDLEWLSKLTGLSIGAAEMLEETELAINIALGEACHLGMIEASRRYGDMVAWCETTATRCDELAGLLISQTRGDHWAAWDAIEVLKPGFPKTDSPELDPELAALLAIAAPDRAFYDRVVGMISQVAPSLQALSLFANRAKQHWAHKVRRGGKPPDRPRRHLMTCLSAIYEQLYGAAPTISVRESTEGAPDRSGKSIDWFRGLFELIQQGLPDEPGAEPLRDILARARVSENVVPGWIRDVRGQGTKKPSKRE